MLDPKRSREFGCDEVAHHLLLAKSCFRLMDCGLKFNIANVPSSFVLDRDNITLNAEIERHIPSALAYSCRHWSDHLCSAAVSVSSEMCGGLHAFLKIQALFWIEAMNLLGSVGKCDPMLRAAYDCVAKVIIPSALGVFSAHDIGRSTRYWRVISLRQPSSRYISVAVLPHRRPRICTSHHWQHGPGCLARVSNGGHHSMDFPNSLSLVSEELARC